MTRLRAFDLVVEVNVVVASVDERSRVEEWLDFRDASFECLGSN